MQEGYAGTGMELVARDAQVSTATLYLHFSSKADLFRQVVENALDEFGRMMTELSRTDGDGMARLDAFVTAYARFHCDPFARAMFRLVAAERKRFVDTAQLFYERARKEFGETLMGILIQLRDEGRLSLRSPSVAAGQLLGMIEHPTLLIPMMRGDDTRCERAVEEICAEALATFMARYGAAAPVVVEAA